MPAVSWGGSSWTDIIIAAGAMLTGIGLVITAVQLFDARRARTVEIVRLLTERWDSDDMIRSRRLISKQGSLEEMKESVKVAAESVSKDYYCYSRYLDFFEQIGASFNDDPRGLRVVYTMLGSSIEIAWKVWAEVIPYVWPGQSTVGANFQELAAHMDSLRHPGPSRWTRFLTAMGPEK
jgi:hypothetical protein